jgi:formylglycine-generating enzyme
MRHAVILLVLVLTWPLPSPGSGQPATGSAAEMVRIPAGSYLPHYSRDRTLVEVAPFLIDPYPVTRAQFAAFLTAKGDWSPGSVKSVYADAGYLRSWGDEVDISRAGFDRLPVTEVSWFAAKSYCEWRNARLPTLDEWEYVAAASETSRDASRDPAFVRRLLDLSTARGESRTIGSGFRNVFGVHDMHGVVWEWVLDFNHLSIPDDSRTGAPHDAQLYCAAGGIRATDATNYPAFLRYAMRGGLAARSTVANVGFRCARSI